MVSFADKSKFWRYGLQLLFYVPPVTDSNKKIQLLGFAQGLISATEVP